MKNGILIFAFLALIFGSPCSGEAQKHASKKKGAISKSSTKNKRPGGHTIPTRTHTPFHGWDYLVTKLKKDGVSEREIKSVFLDPRMPPLGYVKFALAPRESHEMYSIFRSPQKILSACDFLSAHKKAFDASESRYGVSRYGVASILLVETQFGKVLGRELIINRLGRLASVGAPDILTYNLAALAHDDPTVTREKVVARARYLEDTFYPEILALFTMMRTRHIDVLSLRGSGAGAFGIPQFLPSSFLKFGVDGDGDERISLFESDDAILSTAHFLSHYGWKSDATKSQLEKVVWNYNRSDAYVEAILSIADTLTRNQCTLRAEDDVSASSLKKPLREIAYVRKNDPRRRR